MNRCLYSFISYCILWCEVVNIVHAASSSGASAEESSSHLVLFGILSLVVLVCLSIYILIQCGDCYNSEVSSSNHPACATGGYDSGHKWGGSDAGYQPNSYGHVVDINNQAPSYSMIPMNVNQSAGFQRYSTSNTAPSGGHYNPIQDSQEPPPSYSEVR